MVRGQDSPALEASYLLPIPFFVLLGSLDALSFGRGCDTRVDYHLVDGVSALGNDNLQVQVGHARNYNGLGSSAVRVDGVATGARAPTGREDAVVGDSVNLSQVAPAIKSLQGDAINQYRGTVGEEDGSVDGESVAALDGVIAANGGMGAQSCRCSKGQGEHQ